MDQERFDQLYNRILGGDNWDNSALDELLCLSESNEYTKGKEEMTKKAIDTYKKTCRFSPDRCCMIKKEAGKCDCDELKNFIKELNL